MNHGIKYVKAKCKLASVVHTTPLAFGGIASCNCSNLVPFMDVHCVVQLSTAVTLHLATGSNAVRLYGFKAVRGAGTLRHAHPIMRGPISVSNIRPSNKHKSQNRKGHARKYTRSGVCHLGPSLVPNRLCVLYIYSSHKVGP